MDLALTLAREGERRGEVPVGALVEMDGVIIGTGTNCPVGTSDPTAHAEIIALREAGGKTKNYRLTGAVLYVSLEPCLMCFAAAVHARVAKIVYGTGDPKGGVFSTGSFERISGVFNHKIEIESGVGENESSEILKDFFRSRR